MGYSEKVITRGKHQRAERLKNLRESDAGPPLRQAVISGGQIPVYNTLGGDFVRPSLRYLVL